MGGLSHAVIPVTALGPMAKKKGQCQEWLDLGAHTSPVLGVGFTNGQTPWTMALTSPSLNSLSWRVPVERELPPFRNPK